MTWMKMKWKATCLPCPIACKYLTMKKIQTFRKIQHLLQRPLHLQPLLQLETVLVQLDFLQPCKFTMWSTFKWFIFSRTVFDFIMNQFGSWSGVRTLACPRLLQTSTLCEMPPLCSENVQTLSSWPLVHLSPAILAGNSKKFKNAIINTLPSSEFNQKMGIFFHYLD